MRPIDAGDNEQEALWFLGGQRIINALGEWIVDPFRLSEFATPAGTIVSTYRLQGDEARYVLSGAATIIRAGEAVTVSAGTFLFLPEQVSHRMEVGHSGTFKYLTWMTPSGFAQYVTKMGNKHQMFVLAPPHAPDRAKIGHLADLLRARATLAAPEIHPDSLW